MSEASELKGACVWTGAEMRQNPRWTVAVPASLLDVIDAAAKKAGALDWRQVNRYNFPLPGAQAFFDEVREELENGSGMVKLPGLDVARYGEDATSPHLVRDRLQPGHAHVPEPRRRNDARHPR